MTGRDRDEDEDFDDDFAPPAAVPVPPAVRFAGGVWFGYGVWVGAAVVTVLGPFLVLGAAGGQLDLTKMAGPALSVPVSAFFVWSGWRTMHGLVSPAVLVGYGVVSVVFGAVMVAAAVALGVWGEGEAHGPAAAGPCGCAAILFAGFAVAFAGLIGVVGLLFVLAGVRVISGRRRYAAWQNETQSRDPVGDRDGW